MIPEREREALMRLTMCAREECSMCKFQDDCSFDFQRELATKNMNILADALNADRKTENSSEKPNNCETCRFELYCPEMCEGCCEWDSHYEPKNNSTISKMEQVDKDINVRSKDEPNCEECKHFHENAVMYLDQCDFCFKDCKYEPKDEPQNECAKEYEELGLRKLKELLKDEPQTERSE